MKTEEEMSKKKEENAEKVESEEKIVVKEFSIEELKLMYDALGLVQIALDSPVGKKVQELRQRIAEKAESMVPVKQK